MLDSVILFNRLGIAVIVILAFLTKIGTLKELWQENNLRSLTSSLPDQTLSGRQISPHILTALHLNSRNSNISHIFNPFRKFFMGDTMALRQGRSEPAILEYANPA